MEQLEEEVQLSICLPTGPRRQSSTPSPAEVTTLSMSTPFNRFKLPPTTQKRANHQRAGASKRVRALNQNARSKNASESIISSEAHARGPNDGSLGQIQAALRPISALKTSLVIPQTQAALSDDDDDTDYATHDNRDESANAEVPGSPENLDLPSRTSNLRPKFVLSKPQPIVSPTRAFARAQNLFSLNSVDSSQPRSRTFVLPKSVTSPSRQSGGYNVSRDHRDKSGLSEILKSAVAQRKSEEVLWAYGIKERGDSEPTAGVFMTVLVSHARKSRQILLIDCSITWTSDPRDVRGYLGSPNTSNSPNIFRVALASYTSQGPGITADVETLLNHSTQSEIENDRPLGLPIVYVDIFEPILVIHQIARDAPAEMPVRPMLLCTRWRLRRR